MIWFIWNNIFQNLLPCMVLSESWSRDLEKRKEAEDHYWKLSHIHGFQLLLDLFSSSFRLLNLLNNRSPKLTSICLAVDRSSNFSYISPHVSSSQTHFWGQKFLSLKADWLVTDFFFRNVPSQALAVQLSSTNVKAQISIVNPYLITPIMTLLASLNPDWKARLYKHGVNILMCLIFSSNHIHELFLLV